MAYINNSGQVRVGVRTPGVAPVVTVSTLLTSLYSVWNGDTLGTSLDSSIFGAWNGDASSDVTTLNTSLYGSWNANGNINDSLGINNGTAVGGLTYTTGKIGDAFQFNGSNSYVSLPNNSLNFTGDFSMSFWVNLSSNNYGMKYLISSYQTGGLYGYGYHLAINQYYDKLQFVILRGNNQPTQQWVDYTFTPNTWYHVVVCRKSSNYTKYYINGVLISGYYPIGGQTDPTLNTEYTNNQLSNIGGVNNANPLNGKMDGMSIWQKELSTSEISALYNSGNGLETPYSSSVTVYTSSTNDSVGTNNGTAVGGLTYTTGKIGQAFQFNGTNAYVSLPDNSLNFTGDFSVSCWFYASTNTTNSSGLIGNYNDATATGFGMYLYQNRLYAQLANSGGKYSTTYIDNSVLGSWNHAVMVFKKGTGFYLYMNGVLRNSFTTVNNANAGTTPTYSGTQKAYIGLLNYSGEWWWMQNGGKIDAANAWTKALTGDEVTQLYNLGNGTQYPFSVKTLPSSGNQFGVDNGTLMNGCSLTTGKIGQSFTFDGVNDYVALPDNSLNFTGDFSVSAWIYVSNVSGEKYIISNSNGNIFDVNTGWCFGVFDNKVSFWVYPGTSSFTGWLTNTTLSLNTWYHVSVTKKPSQSPLFYINGVLSSTSLYNNTMSNSLNPVYSTSTYPNTKASIGVYRYNNGSSAYAYWNGKIDALNVWQKELTQAEVTELYNSGNGKQITATPIITNGLVLNLDASRKSSYPNAGTTWSDISGNGNNGTLVNGVGYTASNGGAMTFDGVNDRITLQNQNISSTGNWTISSWFSLSALSTVDIDQSLYCQYLPIPGNGRFILLLRNNETTTINKFELFLGSGSGYSNQNIVGTTTAQINAVYNLVATRNGSVFSLYLNGNLEASVNLSSINVSILQTTPEIGGINNGNFGWFNGKIYNTMVYNRSLSTTEVTQNFNATKSRFGL